MLRREVDGDQASHKAGHYRHRVVSKAKGNLGGGTRGSKGREGGVGKSGSDGFERVDLVGFFPSEGFARTTEVTVGGGGAVDGASEIEAFDDAGGFGGEDLGDHDAEFFFGDGAGAEGIDHDRDGFSDADGVGELNFAAGGEASGNDVFGDVSGHVCGGAVDFAGVFSGESAATVTSHAAVSIDDDLAPCESAIAHGTADNKASCGVDVIEDLGGEQVGGDDFFDDFFDDAFADGFVADVRAVLGRDHDRGDFFGFAVFVADGDLGLSVGSEEGEGSVFADSGELFGEAMGEVDGHGHEDVGFVASIAEHHALVASALFFVEARTFIDTLGDIGALLVHRDEDSASLVIEAFVGVIVADFFDGVACDFLEVEGGFGGDLTCDHDQAGVEESFACNTTAGIVFEAGIKDCVRDLIRHFVGVAFGDGFGGKEKILVHSCLPHVFRADLPRRTDTISGKLRFLWICKRVETVEGQVVCGGPW